MKNKIFAFIFFFHLFLVSVFSKSKFKNETFSNRVILSAGIKNFDLSSQKIGSFTFKYEKSLFKNIAIAPFLSYYASNNLSQWKLQNRSFEKFNSSQSYIPIGVLSKFYLDNILHLNSSFDFYIGNSVSLAINKNSSRSIFFGKDMLQNFDLKLISNFNFGIHYHLNKNCGVFFEGSTGVSNIGIFLN